MDAPSFQEEKGEENKPRLVLVTVRSVRSVLSVFGNPRQWKLKCLLCWLDSKNVEPIEARRKMASLMQYYQQLLFSLK